VAGLDYLRLSWEEIEGACKRISEEIIAKGFAGYILVGVSRGGLVPLRLISDYISAQVVSTIGVRFYEDIGRTSDEPEVFFPVQGDVRGKNILLIDDISDTGKSLIAAMDHLRVQGAKEIVVATICKKPHTSLDPDIYETETSAWVIFPWEVQETIKKIVEIAEDRASAIKELTRANIRKGEFEKTLKLKFGGG
jgi:hypoxanthine phosphoribosyltransferase